MDSRGWGSQETRCLISLWGEESVQRKLDDSYRNREIYEGISKQMEVKGYTRSWLQCQRKIKHLKHVFRKAKDNNNKNGISCPAVYKELERVLGDRPSFSPGEGNVLDSELDNNQEEYGRPIEEEEEEEEPPFSATVGNTNVTPAGNQGDVGNGNDTTGPEAAAASSSSSSSSSRSSSSSKRPSSTSGGQTRRKKSKFEMTLEAFTKALCNSKDDNEVLLQMQRAQHAHEEKMFGMMMQSIASLGSRMASAQHPPGHACAILPLVSADATTSTTTTTTTVYPPNF